MIEFGKTLKEAREQKGITPAQIAEQTHMLVQVVEGLEREDFSKIVAPIYGRGFVKLYCETVGLEPKPMVDRFMELYSERQSRHSAVPPVRQAAGQPAEEEFAKPVAPQPPKLDPFGRAAAAASQEPQPSAAQEPPKQPAQSTSRFAAPMPIDDERKLPLDFVNWRVAALGAAAAALLALAFLGVRAIYRLTMTPPERNEPPAVEETVAETAKPSAAILPRTKLPPREFYIDSDHASEMKKTEKGK